MKKFPPRRRLWPAAALLCLLALPLLLPRLSGGQERPRRPRPDGGGGRLLCAPYPLLHPAPLPEQPGGPDTGAGDPGLYGPALPRSPGAARAGVLLQPPAWGGELGTFTIHAPSGEEDVRPVSFQGADGARSCWQLPPPSPGPGRPSGRAAGL